MRHVTIAEKSLLIGDEAADVLMRYAAIMGRASSADAVTLRAYGIDGEEVAATFLLNLGTVMVVESTTSKLPEPDNDEVVGYMLERLAAFDFAGDKEIGVFDLE